MRSSRRAALALTAAALLAPLSLAATPESADPLDAAQYGLDVVNAPEAWQTTTGEDTVVAVVDTGVDLTHPDLQERLVPGRTFLACGAEGCGDGHWLLEDEDPLGDDASGHGTHVAGTIAAANNGIGLTGVAPDAMIMPVRVLGPGGGTLGGIAVGVRWAVDNGADVINMSLGALPGVQLLTASGLLPDLEEAVEYAAENGVVVIASAGNDSAPVCGTPGFDNGAMCIISTDADDLRSYFSNGSVRRDLDVVAAPGGDGLFCGGGIVSTVPEESGEGNCGYPAGYGQKSGTSMAAPHAAGVAALLVSVGCDRDEVFELLETTARTPGVGLRGAYTPVYGNGIVDAQAAVAAAATVCA